MKRPNWIDLYRDTAAKFSTDETANELVLVTRESARLGAAALRQINAQDFYHNNGAAERELLEASAPSPSAGGDLHGSSAASQSSSPDHTGTFSVSERADKLANDLAKMLRETANELYPGKPVLAPEFFTLKHALKNKIVAAFQGSAATFDEGIEAAISRLEQVASWDEFHGHRALERAVADVRRSLKPAAPPCEGDGTLTAVRKQPVTGD